ncbi:MAG: hypothetical protein JOY71_22430 [Acetobacteraceae bacterium]|nr:hypothetical protein [Acetobacteraceae bacterium]
MTSSISSSASTYEELIIQVKPGVSESAVRELSKKAGAELQYSLGGPAYLIRVAPQDADLVMKSLQSEKDVVSVERNQQVHTQE